MHLAWIRLSDVPGPAWPESQGLGSAQGSSGLQKIQAKQWAEALMAQSLCGLRPWPIVHGGDIGGNCIMTWAWCDHWWDGWPLCCGCRLWCWWTAQDSWSTSSSLLHCSSTQRLCLLCHAVSLKVEEHKWDLLSRSVGGNAVMKEFV